MLHRTSGIILHTTRYAESGLIIKVYTRDQGLQSGILNHSGKKGSRKRALLQPLALVDLVLSDPSRSGLKRITELQSLHPYTEIPFNVVKSSIVLFLNEMLYRGIRESHPDEEMFDFIRDSLQILDLSSGNCADFHVYFLLQLSRFLGFFPQGNWSPQRPLFDLQEGSFTNVQPLHPHYLGSSVAKAMDQVLNSGYAGLEELKISRDERKNLLEAMITFYRLHISSMGEIRSHKVLEEVIA